MQPSHFFLGVDLGQRQDPTAMAAVERIVYTGTSVDAATFQPLTEVVYRVRGLRRLKLGTPYTEVAGEVGALARTVAAQGPTTLIVDATGVGAPVVDLLRQELASTSIPLVPVVFTSGDTPRSDGGIFRVPKKDLIHGLVVLFEEGKLRLIDDHPEARALIAELANMRIKVTSETQAGYEAWRQNQHDDLVFALALAVWRARASAPRPQRRVPQQPLVLW